MHKTDTIKVLGLQEFNTTQAEFYVNTLSDHLKTSHAHIEKPHRHNFYAAFFFVKGSGVHEIDFNAYDVRPGSVFLLAPGQTHNWELSADCEGIVYFHSQDFYDTHYIQNALADYPFFSLAQNESAVYLDGNKATEIYPLFEKLLQTNTDDGLKKKQLQLSLITQIYIELERWLYKGIPTPATAHTAYYQKFLQFRKLVEQNYRTEKSAKQYADWMHMTPKHLNRINKLIVNKTTSEVITDHIILEAKRMLTYGKNNFTEIADELGFTDYAHFSKIFKIKTGVTPSGFSRRYL